MNDSVQKAYCFNTYPSDGYNGTIIPNVESGPSGWGLIGTTVALAAIATTAQSATAVYVLLQALITRLQLRVGHYSVTLNFLQLLLGN